MVRGGTSCFPTSMTMAGLEPAIFASTNLLRPTLYPVDAHKLTEPYGLPGRSPTPILHGPCATALRRSTRSIPHGIAVIDQDAHRSDHILSLALGSTARGKAAITTTAGADSTLRTSRAVPHPLTSRDLCRLTPEVERHPANSTRYGRQRPRWLQVGPRLASIFATLCEVSNAK